MGRWCSACLQFGWFLFRRTCWPRLGNATATALDPAPTFVSNTFGGPFGGGQFGYNVLLPANTLLGWEIDASFPNYIAPNASIASVPTAQNHVTEEFDYLVSVRGRMGHVWGPWLFYGTGGVALLGSRVLNDLPSGDEEKRLLTRFGGVLGAGLEYAFEPNWAIRLEYLHGNFARANTTLPSGVSYASTTDFNMLTVALNRKLNGIADLSSERSDEATPKLADWQIHGQTTYIQQGYPTFSRHIRVPIVLRLALKPETQSAQPRF